MATCVVAEVATRKTFRRHRTAWASLGTDTCHEHPLTSININLVGGLEHEFYDFPYIGNNHPNWLSYFSEELKPPTSNYIRLDQWVYQTISDYISEHIRLYQSIRLYHHLLNLVFKISWPIWYIPWHSMTFQVLWSGFDRAASAHSRICDSAVEAGPKKKRASLLRT